MVLEKVVKLVSLCESVEHVLWECSEYIDICEEFIRNLDGILQNDFHLRSSFNKIKYIFDQSIWKCNGHFDNWFLNTKAFCVAYGTCTGRNFIF